MAKATNTSSYIRETQGVFYIVTIPSGFLRDVAAKVMPPIDPNVRRGLEARLRDMHRTAASASKNSYTADNVRAQLEQKLQAFTAPEVQPETKGGRAPKPAPRATSGGDDA